MEIKASLRYLGIAPRKVRLGTDLIRGRSIAAALLELGHMKQRAAGPLLKLLRSAVASARHDFQIDESGLFIKEIRVEGGPVQKRFMPRAFGRTAPRRRRTSHVVLVLGAIKNWAEGKPFLKRKGALSPLVRDVTVDDVRIAGAPVAKKENASDRGLLRQKQRSGFVRRIFQRKAI